MTEMLDVLRGIAAPINRLDDAALGGLSVLDGLVLRSNLLGADRAVANQGGGNTSAKETIVDHAGRDVRVLWVKGSGTDLATITPAGFPGIRLDELLPLRERESMTDAEMVDYLLRSAIKPDQPRPSIETLLHAFVPAPHVDHTHPDAVIALTSTPSGRELAEKTFGDEIVWLDYQRPGFDMSRRIALLLEQNPAARAVLLEKHGLVTWGETGAESYERTIEFVSRAARAIDEAAAGRFGLGGQHSAAFGEGAEVRLLLSHSLPELRGALLADSDGVILEVDRSPEAIAFASAERTPEVSQIGAPCPDHLINTKHKPLAVEFDAESDDADALGAALTKGVADYGDWYRAYYERNLDDETRQFPIDPAGPRVVLIPGVGIVTAGPDAGRARFARDLYHRAIAVEDAADALGGFTSLSESEAFAIEYWPLERYKLAQAPPRGELAGRVALITGGASGIGRATARLLAARGAHVVVADLNVDGAQEVADELVATFGLRRGLAVHVDVTSEDAVIEMTRRAVLEYGGIDILVRVGRARHERADHRDDDRGLGAELRRPRTRLLPRGARDVQGAARAEPRWLGRVRRLEERACRRRERRGLLVGEGRVAAPGPLSRGGGRPARDPRQHRQPRRRDPGQWRVMSAPVLSPAITTAPPSTAPRSAKTPSSAPTRR